MERRTQGVVRGGIVIPYDSAALQDGTEVEIVFHTEKTFPAKYKANHFSLQTMLCVTAIACCVATSPRLAMAMIFIIGGLGIGIACVRGAVTHRPTGWFSGVLFGFMVILMTIASMLSFRN